MCSIDFEYDGRRLDEFGFIICDFNGSSGIENVSAGSNIEFTTVPMHYGKKHSLAGTRYGECISASFDICKNTCVYDGSEIKITDAEFRDLMRWLNRREFLPFRVFDDENPDRDMCYYNASFNVEKVMLGDDIIGLHLTMETDSPFGYGDRQEMTWEIDGNSIKYTDVSDEIGYIYPDLEITCGSAGDLRLSNSRMVVPMVVKNCASGEKITIDGENQIITSSLSSHNVMDDFNYQFFQIINTYDDRVNVITSSIPVTVKLSYEPIIKNSV